jgi:hypothetical protein
MSTRKKNTGAALLERWADFPINTANLEIQLDPKKIWGPHAKARTLLITRPGEPYRNPDFGKFSAQGFISIDSIKRGIKLIT